MSIDLKELAMVPPALFRHAADHPVLQGALSRVELNLSGLPFPGWSTPDTRRKVADTLLGALRKLPQYVWAFCAEMCELKQDERRLLLERGQLTAPLASRQDGAYVLINDTQDTLCFINDEEHLYLETFLPGSASENTAREMADARREHFRRELPVAWDDFFGLLMSAPDRAGSGSTISYLLFLPGLRISGQMEQVLRALEDLKLYMLPAFPYVKKDTSDLWILHAPGGLMYEQAALYDKAHKLIAGIIRHELQARVKNMEDSLGRQRHLKNMITALHELTHSDSLRFSRTLEALSLLRLGLHYGCFRAENASAAESAERLARAYTETAPLHLQHCVGLKAVRDRRKARAAYMKELIANRLNITSTL